MLLSKLENNVMWAYQTLKLLLMLVAWVVVPVQLVTTFVLGILVSLTFGLLLLPISLIWMVLFLGPLLGLSWVWGIAPFLRGPIAIVGIPWAFAGHIYAALMPSMGEQDSRVSKLLLAESWPYTLDCWRMIGTGAMPKSPGADVTVHGPARSSEGMGWRWKWALTAWRR